MSLPDHTRALSFPPSSSWVRVLAPNWASTCVQEPRRNEKAGYLLQKVLRISRR